jgi:hypothetical protein
MYKLTLILIASVLLPLTAYADKCASWGCISSIETLYTNADGVIYVGTPLDESLANCTPISNVYFSLNPSRQNAEKIYSSLLAAYMSGGKIQLRVKEGTNNCELSYVRLDKNF